MRFPGDSCADQPFPCPQGPAPSEPSAVSSPTDDRDTKSPQCEETFLDSGRSCPDSARRHTPGWDSATGKEAWELHPRPLPHGVLHSLPLAPPSRAFLTQTPGENKSNSLAFPGMWCRMLQLLFSLMLVSLGSVGRSGAGEWGRCAGAPLERSQLGFAGCRM